MAIWERPTRIAIVPPPDGGVATATLPSNYKQLFEQFETFYRSLNIEEWQRMVVNPDGSAFIFSQDKERNTVLWYPKRAYIEEEKRERVQKKKWYYLFFYRKKDPTGTYRVYASWVDNEMNAVKSGLASEFGWDFSEIDPYLNWSDAADIYSSPFTALMARGTQVARRHKGKKTYQIAGNFQKTGTTLAEGGTFSSAVGRSLVYIHVPEDDLWLELDGRDPAFQFGFDQVYVDEEYIYVVWADLTGYMGYPPYPIWRRTYEIVDRKLVQIGIDVLVAGWTTCFQGNPYAYPGTEPISLGISYKAIAKGKVQIGWGTNWKNSPYFMTHPQLGENLYLGDYNPDSGQWEVVVQTQAESYSYSRFIDPQIATGTITRRRYSASTNTNSELTGEVVESYSENESFDLHTSLSEFPWPGPGPAPVPWPPNGTLHAQTILTRTWPDGLTWQYTTKSYTYWGMFNMIDERISTGWFINSKRGRWIVTENQNLTERNNWFVISDSFHNEHLTDTVSRLGVGETETYIYNTVGSNIVYASGAMLTGATTNLVTDTLDDRRMDLDMITRMGVVSYSATGLVLEYGYRSFLWGNGDQTEKLEKALGVEALQTPPSTRAGFEGMVARWTGLNEIIGVIADVPPPQ